MSDLTILTITDYPPHAAEYLERAQDLARDLDAAYVEFDGTGAGGGVEHVQDAAVAICPDGYILLLADDENPDAEMTEWLHGRYYRQTDNWCFARLNYYPDTTSCVMYPDLQTRLATKEKSGGRTRLHQGSPWGTGWQGGGAIEHWKMLVQSLEVRRAQIEERERMQRGAGYGFRPYVIPEDCPGIQLTRLPVAV